MAKTIMGKIINFFLIVFKGKFAVLIDGFYNAIPNKLKPEIEGIIHFVDKLNDYIQSPTVDVITAIIPGNVDDELVKAFRIILPIISDKYKTALTGPQKHEVAANIISGYTGYKFGESAILAEVVFQKIKK